jgi:hypothetical protein
MRPFQALTLASTLTALLACAARGPETSPVTTTSARRAPAWIDNEEIPDGLGAVGIAQPNPMGDKTLQRTTAAADARARLAGKLKVRIQSMFSRLDQQVATAAAGAAGRPIRTEVMARVVDNVTRQLVDQDLAGAGTRAVWTDPGNGDLYVFVVLAGDALDRSTAGAAHAAIQKEIAQGGQALDASLEKLDAAIAASPKS